MTTQQWRTESDDVPLTVKTNKDGLPRRHRGTLTISVLSNSLLENRALTGSKRINLSNLARRRVRHIISRAHDITLTGHQSGHPSRLTSKLRPQRRTRRRVTPRLTIYRHLLNNRLTARNVLLGRAHTHGATFVLHGNLMVRNTARYTFRRTTRGTRRILMVRNRLTLNRITRGSGSHQYPITLRRMNRRKRSQR